ncbi:MAG: hypothetical protein CL878_08730 [Dehalococcoidia bacterium]|nr:hypothetical protein [Dehalococcoidia bacterium]
MSRARDWRTRGFDGFRQGTFGSAGQNVYVSRAGVLQRIHQYDLNRNGYVDLLFCNSQNHHEKAPAYIYRDPLGQATRSELPSDGAWSGAVADLNGDGYDDLVLGMGKNGIRLDLNVYIYYGSPDGWSERRQQLLPAPLCLSIAAGDFNGDGRSDLAFLCQRQWRTAGSVTRLFYQTELGFEPKRSVDLPIEGEQLAASDLDGDGYADLVVRDEGGSLTVYWGGPEGLDPERSAPVPLDMDAPGGGLAAPDEQAQYEEYAEDASPLVQVIHLEGVPHLFAARERSALLVPVQDGRRFGRPLELACTRPMAIAVGDVDGDSHMDLVVACRHADSEGECSWIYWGSENCYSDERRTRLPSSRAGDIAVADLDGNGHGDIVLCQGRSGDSFTTGSLIYQGTRGGVLDEPVRLRSEDPRRVFAVRPSGGEYPDVLFVNRWSRNAVGDVPPTIYFGGADGFSLERREDVPGFGAVEAACCDLNDDGRVDLVLANCAENAVSRDPGSYVLYGGSEGFGDEPSLRLPTVRAHGVACADLNRDGYLDLVFGGFNNPDLVIYYGSAGGFGTTEPQRIQMEHRGTAYDEPRWIYLADLNRNGWLDLVVPQIASDRSFVLWGGPDGFSMDRCQFLSVWHGACARAADLNGNGYLDLIIGGHAPSRDGPHDSFAYIYWNGPDGLREDRRTLLPANAINAMTVADFNNDGLLDLFICSYHDGRVRDIDSYVYWNRLGQGFSATDRTRLFTHSASGCMAADFNENGWIDLAIANHKVDGDHVGYSTVWWNGPEGFGEDRVTPLPTSGPHGMTAVGPGNIADRGHEEYYLSPPFKLPPGAAATAIRWEADEPPKTWVKAQLRFAPTEASLEPAVWVGPGRGAEWFANNQEVEGSAFAGQWVQYRLALGSVNSGRTPRVTEVAVSYSE